MCNCLFQYETETIVHDALLSDVAELNNQVEFYNHVKSVLLRHIEKYRAYEVGIRKMYCNIKNSLICYYYFRNT